MRRLILLPIVLSLAALPARASELEVHVLSSVDGDARPPDPREKLVRLGTRVTLQLAVRGDGLPLVSEANEVVLRAAARTLRARPPASLPGTWRVRWSKIEAASHSLSNTDPSFHWHDIDYRYVPIPACDDRFRCEADVRATVLGDRGGLGTMAFRAEVRHGERHGASTGFEKRYRGGLAPDIARVTVRRDDTYLGYLTELFNTPYIWGSAGSDSVHQAERRIGSDCADFVTYGVRRLGHDIPYTSTWSLPKYTRALYASPGPSPDGVYRDASGSAIPFGARGVRAGDLLLFPGHVGAIVRDEAPLGVLSASDVMVHTSWLEPIEQALAHSDYGRSSMKVVRWKVLDR